MNYYQNMYKNLIFNKYNKMYSFILDILGKKIRKNSTNKYILNDFFLSKYEITNNIPYIIGVTGSVAVGKTTISKLLQFLLQTRFNKSKVELINTDSFLYPNYILNNIGLMHKKGFPESYDINLLFSSLFNIKKGISSVSIPVYSHKIYDIIPKYEQIINLPDIIIIEGLNILQNISIYNHILISDFIDFSIYIDSSEELLKCWYINRFFQLIKNSRSNLKSIFYNYNKITKFKIYKIANKFWEDINLLNLKLNILPTRDKADLIIYKSDNHSLKLL
ncbi:type I pantothenate kinase [Buchnera aphidicola (Neophyllaphis podocarpi)]|uniref:type I pantothenate kinase n=1 Tax=Buchnera aphidicola TaxID=9 RepID=UPI0031B813C3